MRAREFLSHDMPELQTVDGADNALTLMDEYRVSHLPVVENGFFLGMVSEDELEVLEHPNKKLINGFHELMDLKVGPDQHIYTVLKLFSDHHLSIVPVVDEEGVYMGSISQADLINKLALSQAVSDPGGIIILEINFNDYSLQEISGIVEGNDAKVLSSTLTTFPNSTKAEVTLKVNREDLDGILQTFERYGYSVKASFHESRYVEDMKDRYDEFIKYLNM